MFPGHLLSNISWHRMRAEHCVYKQIFQSELHFYNIKKSKKIFRPLAWASTSRQPAFPINEAISDLLEAWPNVISGKLPRWGCPRRPFSHKYRPPCPRALVLPGSQE